MSKELIVSLNGREKKIAIIENGKVTEFYIERGEDGQGIVGNIYKGRVMRVLPGMQSAFVDIGLERDAFLYVSDFFDEEEEFERIVVDKTKTEGADAATAARAAAEKIERSRLERERQMETAQERAQPVIGGEDEEDEDEDEATDIEAPREAAQQSESATPSGPVAVNADEEDESATETRGGRGRRDRKRRGGREDATREVGAAATAGGGSNITPPSTSFAEDVQARLAVREEINTPFVAADNSFERVVDDEAAATNGEMFKDARLQERLTDQIHAAEFDFETPRDAEVGSLLSSENITASSNAFQRIADDDDEADEPRSVEAVQPAVAATVSAFIEETDDSALTSVGAQSFERVSDDDKAAEGATETAADDEEATTSARGRASKSRRTTTGKSKKAASDAPAEETATADETGAKKGGRSRAPKEAASKKSAAKGKQAATKGGSTRRGSKAKTGSEAAADATAEGNAPDDAAAATQTSPDAEAGVKSRRSRDEFAR
ncbi:MAG TPA: hypothetical protein VF634_10310, partial [Pyrinomonadaceae bacterium]